MGNESTAVTSYRDLEVWKVWMNLAVASCAASRLLPKDELFGLTSQIRRSAASLPANIAEGYGREQTGSYIQFLRIAQGSLKELETHVILAQRLGLIAADNAEALLSESEKLGRMIRSLIRALQRKLQQ